MHTRVPNRIEIIGAASNAALALWHVPQPARLPTVSEPQSLTVDPVWLPLQVLRILREQLCNCYYGLQSLTHNSFGTTVYI